jgi:hypothetical protein
MSVVALMMNCCGFSSCIAITTRWVPFLQICKARRRVRERAELRLRSKTNHVMAKQMLRTFCVFTVWTICSIVEAANITGVPQVVDGDTLVRMEKGGGRRWFCTPEEAEAAGWRRALN